MNMQNNNKQSKKTKRLPRIDSKEFIPLIPFRADGVTLLEVIMDPDLSPAEALFFLHLTAIFHKRRFEGRNLLSSLFPRKYKNPVAISRKFQALKKYGYLKIERVLQSQSFYEIAELKVDADGVKQ